MDIQRQATQIGNIRFDRGACGDEATPKQRGRVLERKIPVNPTQPLITDRDFDCITETSNIGVCDSPKQKYHEFMSFDQAGPATIAFHGAYNLYAIKKHKRNPDLESRRAELFRHSCLVDVLDIFRRADEIHVVYECMDVSLQHILATPRGHLDSTEIAVICKQVGVPTSLFDPTDNDQRFSAVLFICTLSSSFAMVILIADSFYSIVWGGSR